MPIHAHKDEHCLSRWHLSASFFESPSCCVRASGCPFTELLRCLKWYNPANCEYNGRQSQLHSIVTARQTIHCQKQHVAPSQNTSVHKVSEISITRTLNIVMHIREVKLSNPERFGSLAVLERPPLSAISSNHDASFLTAIQKTETYTLNTQAPDFQCETHQFSKTQSVSSETLRIS